MNLKDPSKAAHEIVEVLEDGDAIRNDGVVLQAANKNPWYVLATIYGEQKPANESIFDRELAERNRRAWNIWFCQKLSEGDRADRAEKSKLTVAELAPLPDQAKAKAELAEIKKRFHARMGKRTKLPAQGEEAIFYSTHFSKPVSFEKMVFEGNASFDFSVFKSFAYFRSSVFGGNVDFRSSSFSDNVYFSSSFFGGNVDFSSSVFGESVYFSSSFFDSNVDFGLSVFGGNAYFSASTFCGYANFISASFKSTTRFNDVHFRNSVPQFHGADLYGDTVFSAHYRDVTYWPLLKGKNVMPAEAQKRAYNRLQLFMNQSLQVDEEQFFHMQEMRCKRETEGWQYRWIYSLFAGVSDYGHSVLRPAGWLFVIWLSGVWAKLGMVKGGVLADLWSIGPAMGWSFANLFSFFGFYRRYFRGEDLNDLLQLFSGVQTVLGFALLFMLGLGLRNRFRLR